MKTKNEADVDQILEDKMFSDPMFLVEMIGWALFVASLLIGLVVLKLSVPIGHIGWILFVGGLCLVAWGGCKRDKNNRCNIMSDMRRDRT